MSYYVNVFKDLLEIHGIKYPQSIYKMTLDQMLNQEYLTASQKIKLIKIKQGWHRNNTYECKRQKIRDLKTLQFGDIVYVDSGEFNLGVVQGVVYQSNALIKKLNTVIIVPLSQKFANPIASELRTVVYINKTEVTDKKTKETKICKCYNDDGKRLAYVDHTINVWKGHVLSIIGEATPETMENIKACFDTLYSV